MLSGILRSLIDLLFYGNFWIAACAMAMSLQTQYILTGKFSWHPFQFFVFFATLFLYAIHRIVGLKKVSPFKEQGRYKVISRFKDHILVYALLSVLLAGWFYWQLSFKFSWMFFIPCLISLAYVLPVLGKKRRLRDFGFLKIFLIAITWAWVTVILSAREVYFHHYIPAILMFLERTFFIFAITLPFDIRDLEIDKHTQLKTLPSQLGNHKTKILGGISLFLMIGCSFINYSINAYQLSDLLALIISALLSMGLIYYSDKVKHDYYFTGLIDGMMLVQLLLILLVR